MAKLCYCGAPVRADGFCRYRCTPELRPSFIRRKANEEKRKSRAARVEAETIGITEADQQAMIDRMAAIDPVAAHKLRIARQKKRGVKL